MSTTLEELKEKLEEIKACGFIKTHRANDTGIGKTLEDLLGIKENNIQLPDIGDIEIKAKRIDSDSMLTVGTKSPLPRGVNKKLYLEYGYPDKKDGYMALHSTVYGSRENPQFFKIDLADSKLTLKNKQNIEVYWPITIFDLLKAKSNKILLVLAKTSGETKTINEEFHYIEAYLLSGLNMDKFRSAVKDGKLKIDIRIGSYKSGKRKGKYHDHGTALRINKRNYLNIFNEFKKII
ncbi:MAG: MvaI/BcnI family restriction endonuclease [Deltaproteobacteria bacterium]|nr:MvaI/BcnI family restriction endonuclease [Deltaproteobacteria bacterium]